MRKVKAAHIPPVKAKPISQSEALDDIRARLMALVPDTWQTLLMPEEIKAGRILRGHRRAGCKCRFCSIPAIPLVVYE